jgi:S1-C subfamily serine protease
VGSGVIVSPQGHIVTNFHVVRDNLPCVVRFVDGTEYRAKIKGRDPDSDLAVLEIDAAGRELHPIVIADSDRVRVGDIVFAIGSPFGYTHSVTSGIVSAKHRRLEFNQPYEDYLQTDAAINPGNSGGALVNIRGELVGVNTAMVSGSRTNDGVGLAIASNLVKWVEERLIRDGEVRRGYMGVQPIDVNYADMRSRPFPWGDELSAVQSQEELVRQLGLKEAAGALVALVIEESPADRAGLQVGDVITEFEGRPIRGKHDLFFRVAEIEPGRTVKLKVLRDKKAQETSVTLALRGLSTAGPPAKPPK